MIDTISIYSPDITDSLASELEYYMLRKQAIYNGNIIYSFDVIPYEGTYTNKINIVVSREKWVYNVCRKIAEKVDCKPYIKLEGSLHKFFLGHNCYGGSNNIYRMVHNMLQKIKKDLGLKCNFPMWHSWFVNRIDYANIYRVGTQDNVLNYFNSMRNVHYPRGKVNYYAGESLYRGGRTTSIKLYNKYQEFKKHDYKIWKKNYPLKAEEILNNSKDIIRIEVEIKRRKFIYDYGKTLTLKEIRISYLDRVYNEEIKRLLNEGENMRSELKDNNNVRLYLYNKLSTREFNVLYGFYNDIAINGYEIVKNSMSKSTFYRNMKKLKEYGINYKNNDIAIINQYKFNPFQHKPDNTDLIAI